MSRKRPHSEISTSIPTNPPIPPLPDIGPLSPNSSGPLQSLFGADSLNLTNEEANAWQAFFNGTPQPLPDFDFGADLNVDMLDLPDPADFGVDFDTVLPGFVGAGELTLNGVGEEGNGNECLDGAWTGVGDSGVLPTTGVSIGVPGDGAIEVNGLFGEPINQPRSPGFSQRVYTEIGCSTIHPPDGPSYMPGSLPGRAPETGAGVRTPTNSPGNLTETPQSICHCTTEPVASNPNPAKRPLPSPEPEQEEEIPMKKKRLRRKKDQPEPDYSAIIRAQVQNAKRTGQACDRCKVCPSLLPLNLKKSSNTDIIQVKRMKCDSNPKTCLNCRIYKHKCKTTDLTTGITSTRGEITEVKQDLEMYERDMEELEMENESLRDEVESLRGILGQAGLAYKGYQYPVGYVRSCGCLCPLHAFPPSARRRRRRFRAQPQNIPHYQCQPPQPSPYPHPHPRPQKKAGPNQTLVSLGYGCTSAFPPQSHQNLPLPPPAPSVPMSHIPTHLPAQFPIHIPASSHTPAPTAPQNITGNSNPAVHRTRPLPHHHIDHCSSYPLPNQPNPNLNINHLSRLS